MQYRNTAYAANEFDTYWFEKNMQGDIIAVYNDAGTLLITYHYDAWGNVTTTYSNGGASTNAVYNPFKYRGYYHDSETGWYYLQSRYYNPTWGRFINADGYVSTGTGLLGYNMFAYCNNNPVNCVDPTGQAWWHWAVGAAVVVACAVAVVVTAGGAAAGMVAVAAVANGMVATTTASTVAAGMFIGAATTYAAVAFDAMVDSSSLQEFCDQGDWGDVGATMVGMTMSAIGSYLMDKSLRPQETFLPSEYYSNKKAPTQSTPNSSYTNYTYNEYTGKYEKSIAFYDIGGRQTVRIDFTNHGYSNHGNPHVHITYYNAQYPNGKTIRWD